MKKKLNFNIGLSEYAITAYVALVKNHPVNGSQLSRHSGIPRARIYDVLRLLKEKGYAVESSAGIYVPLPPDQMIKNLRHDYEAELTAFETQIKKVERPLDFDFIWIIRGHAASMEKAKEMIASAKSEIYVRIFREEAQFLDPELHKAEAREVQVKYIAMSSPPPDFDLMVLHPECQTLEETLGGRSIEIVVDREEILSGMFAHNEDERDARLTWGKNKWFVVSGRDSLRHDFFHYFLHKTFEKNEKLSFKEKALFDLINKDT